MKPRSDSLLFSLGIEDQEKLNNWLLENHSLTEVQKFLAAEAPEGMGLKVQQTTLRRYYDRVMPEYIASRRQSALATARHLKTAIETDPNEFDAPTLDALKQRVFELTLSPESNPDTIYKLYRLVLRAKDQELAREKFEYNASKSIMKNFDKIAKIMRDRDKSDSRETLDQIRLSVFGALTDAESPLTGDDYKPPASEPEPSSATSGLVNSNINPTIDYSDFTGSEKKDTGPIQCDVPIDQSPPKFASTIGDIIIMTPEKYQPAAEPPIDLPTGPEVFEPDPQRNIKVTGGTDYYGPYVQFEYADGNNPQGDTKYFIEESTGRCLRRKRQ
jgi:hypothetical protein